MATARRTAAPARAAARTAPRVSSGFRGAEGLRQMREEEKRQEARKEAQAQMSGMPFRFFCRTGESREIVIVDEAPDFFRYEHNLKNNHSGKWDIFTACVKDHANCPVCKASERSAYFAMYLTIIDLTEYENNDGEVVPWSKKLLVVKPQQQKKIMRIFEREGSLRGVVLQMTRDGDKDASIGNDIEVIETMSEEDLLTYEDTYTDKKGKEHEVIGHEVFDYDELFPAPTEEQLRAIVGGSPEPGSRASDRRALRDSDDGGDDGWAGGRGAVRRRAPVAADDAPPAGRRPIARRAVREDPPVEDEVPGDDAPDDAPPPRRAASRAAPPTRQASSRAAPARRAVRDDPPDEPEDPPQRGGGMSLAERRRALRR